MSRILIPVVLLLTGSFGVLAQEPSRAKAVQKVYAVAELVVPIDSFKECGTEECCPACPAHSAILAPVNTTEDKLIQTITRTVRPKCWTSAGGNCSLEYFPIGMGLVVHAPDDVQHEVAALLDKLRKQQDTTIAVTLRVLTVSDEFFQRFGLDTDFAMCGACAKVKTTCIVGKDDLQRVGCDFACDECCEKGCSACTSSVGLNDKQVQMLLEAAQGDRRACITHAPRLTLFNGQKGVISLQDKQVYVTSVTMKIVEGKEMLVPENTEHATGLKMSVRGTLSADAKRIALELDASHTYLENPEIPLFPVTYFVTPKFSDGNSGKPIPFTQFIQQPKFKTLSVDSQFTVPCGGSMLVYGGTIEKTECFERSVPVLSKIPYVNRLFKKVGYSKCCEHMLVLVTPQVQHDEEAVAVCPVPPTAKPCGEEQASAAVVPMPVAVKPASESRVANVATKLVAKYHEACAKGDMELAREFAHMALDLDPACFSKPYAVTITAPSAPLTPVSLPMPSAAGAPIAPAPLNNAILRAVHEDLNQRLPARFVTPTLR